MSSTISVVEYFREITDLLAGKFLVVPSAVGGQYEIKEKGQTPFSVTPKNLANHSCVSLEKGANAATLSVFKVGHSYAHRRADRLFVTWDAINSRIVYFACELKSTSTGGAWTQLQVTLAFARQLDALVRVNRALPHPTVFAAATVRSMPIAVKNFAPASFSPLWTKPLKNCPLGICHTQYDRAQSPLRLGDVVASLP
jgi:hypothetical protein